MEGKSKHQFRLGEPGTSIGPVTLASHVLYLDLDDCIFCGPKDRDAFIYAPDNFSGIPRIPELFIRYHKAGWRLAGIMEAPGVCLGRYTMQRVISSIQVLQYHLGGTLDVTSLCTHSALAKDMAGKQCFCRKPKPGILITCSEQLGSIYPFEVFPPHLALVVGKSKGRATSSKWAAMQFMHFDEWVLGNHISQVESAING